MAKEIQYYRERYKGSLEESDCDKLEELITLDSLGSCVDDLSHIIYNMSDKDVDKYISDFETKGYATKVYDKPVGTLRDYQTLGVAFGFYAGNFILGDEVGTGKTVEIAGLVNLKTVEYAQKHKSYRYLLLTEKNLSAQVRKEMVKFTGSFVSRIKSSEEKEVAKFIEENPFTEELEYSVVGTHHLLKTPMFIAWLEQCKTYGKGFPFDMLIIDESSVLGGKTTNQIVKGYKSIAKNFKKIVFLNATPFETNLMVFYNQLNLLDSKLLPTRENFEKQYCIMKWNGMYNVPSGKYKNQEEFKKYIGYFYFARTRADKGATMEDCSGRVILSPLSPLQKEWLQKTQLNRLIYDCPTHIEKSIEFNEINVPKLASLRELLETDCKDAEQILIFSHFKEAQNCLSEWLTSQGYSNKILNGETKNKDRDTVIDGFKNKEYRILITNVQKGLNFGSCNYCIFYSFDPNPSKMIQFEGRTTRSFDIKGKNVYVLCSKGQEERTLNEIVKQRAKSTTELSNVGLSVIMNILLGGFDD
jgi:superfamily II DNA or RNA helicase